MHLLLYFRAPVRVLLASAALVVFLPAMALAPSAHALAWVPVTRVAPAVVIEREAPIPPRPTFDELSAECDRGSTSDKGAPACTAAAYTYLRGKGLTADQAAGVVGNLWLESSRVSPKSRQFGGGPGRGIAQWTVYQRWQGVVALAATRGVSPESLQVQLDYLWHELNSTYAGALAAVKSAPTLHDAALAFQNKFEVPIGTDIGGSPYAVNAHQHAHTADRLRYAEHVRKRPVRPATAGDGADHSILNVPKTLERVTP